MLRETLELLQNLKECIKDDERFKSFEYLSELIKSDVNVIEKSKDFKNAEEKYNYALEHFGDSSKETTNAKKVFLEKKSILDSLDIVKKYNNALVKVNDILRKIDYTLFEDLKSNNFCKNCHD